MTGKNVRAVNVVVQGVRLPGQPKLSEEGVSA
jgi:hypothetical protein